mgnify:CR=1 FL=1
MTTQAIITCVILVITMVLLISQKVPLVILGAAIPAALAATGVINAGSAGEALQFLRRARGFAPLPIPLSLPAPAAEEVSRETFVLCAQVGCDRGSVLS